MRKAPDPITFRDNTYENPGYDHKKQPHWRNATHQLAMAFQVRAYPTLIFIDEDFNLIQSMTGFRNPVQFEPILRFFGDNDYKAMTWEDYMAGFQSEL